MLIDVRKLNGIYLVCGKTDLRCGIDGLARVVTEQYDLDPYDKYCSCFVGPARIATKRCIGMVMAFYCGKFYN